MSQFSNEEDYNDEIVSKTLELGRDSIYGLGFAISGGKDNPAVLTGDTTVIVSDVIKGGPAWNKLKVNFYCSITWKNFI